MNFKHYVLTRFNVKSNFAVKNPNNSPLELILDESYLEERFKIFEKYTLPSIINQTNQNFKWIILFHKRTPRKFLRKIKLLKNVYKFEDLYFDDNEHFNFSDYCIKNNEISDFYITTRIDNDDMINKDYIDIVQKYAKKKAHECFISFPNGEKLDLNFNKRIDVYDKYNHFTSRIEENYEKTVLNYDHSAINTLDTDFIAFETKKPMWTEIIHNTNIVNEIRVFEIEKHHSAHGTKMGDDLAIYQLIELKNRLNKEKQSYLNDNISIDDYTYGKPKIQAYSGVKLNIGKFCCIEIDVTFLLGGEHRTDWITTYPFNVLVKEFNNIKGHPLIKGDINVGNDVWLCHGAKILSGVTIGDGAVITANSLVNTDVPNYAIVGGNPAKVIGYRFDKKTIKKLEKIKWWNFKEDKLVKIIPFIQNNNIEKFFEEIEKLDK